MPLFKNVGSFISTSSQFTRAECVSLYTIWSISFLEISIIMNGEIHFQCDICQYVINDGTDKARQKTVYANLLLLELMVYFFAQIWHVSSYIKCGKGYNLKYTWEYFLCKFEYDSRNIIHLLFETWNYFLNK